MRSILDDLPKKTFDPKAFTVAELCDECGLGNAQMGKIIREKVALGLWEKVWRKNNGRPVPAYRLKKSK
jgi:hypothetical protein